MDHSIKGLSSPEARSLAWEMSGTLMGASRHGCSLLEWLALGCESLACPNQDLVCLLLRSSNNGAIKVLDIQEAARQGTTLVQCGLL